MRGPGRAFLHEEAARAADCVPKGWRGTRIVRAPQALAMSAAQADRLGAFGGVHDLPQVGAAGARFEAGEPVVTVSAEAPDEAALCAVLNERAARVHALLSPLCLAQADAGLPAHAECLETVP